MITFDGCRLTYVGEWGAFFLYPSESIELQLQRAIDGCVSEEEAEKALVECELYLLTFVEENVA